MKILVSYRAIPQSPGWATGDMVVRALRQLGHDVSVYAKYYQKERWVENPVSVLADEYDLLLFMECNDGDPQYTELRSVRAIKTACWLFDTSYYPDLCRSLVDYFNFDHIFLANPLTISQYKHWGYNNVHYLPYACDPELHYRPANRPRSLDIALVGSSRPDREALVRQTNNKLTLISNVFREDYVDVLASTNIIVNQNPDAGRGLLNMRHFEAQAAGCILFEQWNDLSVNLSEGLDCEPTVINYNSPEDILDLYESYNYMDADIIQEHQAEFLKKHTYLNRCITLISEVFKHG